MYSAELIADYMIERATRNYAPISNLRLQKYLYFVQAEFLVNTGKPCFNDDIAAWSFGPVVPKVYQKYKKYGSMVILYIDTKSEKRLRSEDRKMIDSVMDRCKDKTVSQLTDATLKQTPWLKAYSPYTENVITNESIEDFFYEGH